MCRRVTCESCSKPTWAGCGMHIEQALAGVPLESRCKCREQAALPMARDPLAKDAGRRKWWPFG